MSEILKQIEAMHDCVKRRLGPDVIIVVSSTRGESEFWRERLEQTKGLICRADARIICVDEDWPGGAGNLLGTLYAFNKASGKCSAGALAEELKAGCSVHMYHTAGKGTRLYPLPAVEFGSKPAVKLPGMLETPAGALPITIPEAVIFQTAIFAPSRGGRLSVWWGDQVFVPSVPVHGTSKFHAEIVTQILTVSPDLEAYGLILPGPEGSIEALREKQSWKAILELVGEGGVAGKSIGSFSLGVDLLEALLVEFDGELSSRKGKLDTDPHLWQPTTTTREDYVSRGGDGQYWERVNSFRGRFLDRNRGKGYLGYVDIGEESLWWDFGSTEKLYGNLMKLVKGTPGEREAMMRFFSISDPLKGSVCGEAVVKGSVVLSSGLGSGIVRDSVVIDSQIDVAAVKGCIVTSSALSSLRGEGALIYGCMEGQALAASGGEVDCDIALPGRGMVRVKTALERDGKKDWEELLPGNSMSYAAMSDLVGRAGMAAMERERKAATLRPLTLRPVQSYCDERANSFVVKPWGGSKIPLLKNISYELGPIGESWEVSTHPDKPTPIEYRYGHNASLADLVGLFPGEVLGESVLRRYGPRLPIIVKIIEARENLSVQVHPTDVYASHHGLESGKTEAWYVLAAEEGAKIFLGFREKADPARFERDLHVGGINIADRYMNDFDAREGDVFLVKAGTLHAIGSGITLLEIQQASGVTYRVWDWNRAGLDGKPRQLHIDEAMHVLSFAESGRKDYCPERVILSDDPKREVLVSTKYFQAELLRLNADQYAEKKRDAFCSITVLSGRGEISYGSEKYIVVKKGRTYFLPAAMGEWRLRSDKEMVAYIARPGL